MDDKQVFFWIAIAPLGVFLWVLVIAFTWNMITVARERWKQ